MILLSDDARRTFDAFNGVVEAGIEFISLEGFM
jgi:hypothetical protein